MKLGACGVSGGAPQQGEGALFYLVSKHLSLKRAVRGRAIGTRRSRPLSCEEPTQTVSGGYDDGSLSEGRRERRHTFLHDSLPLIRHMKRRVIPSFRWEAWKRCVSDGSVFRFNKVSTSRRSLCSKPLQTCQVGRFRLWSLSSGGDAQDQSADTACVALRVGKSEQEACCSNWRADVLWGCSSKYR